jgi:hypothetical protein
MLNGLSNVYPVVPLAEMAKDMKREQVREQNVVAKNSARFVSKADQQEGSREAMREKSEEEELLRRLEAKRQQIEINEKQEKQKRQSQNQNANDEEAVEPDDEQELAAADNQESSAEAAKIPFYRSPRFQKQAVNAYTYIEKHPSVPPVPHKDLTI